MPHPSYYNTQWANNNIYWTWYASPDSTKLNPVGFLTSLKSKRLQGVDLSSLSLSVFGFENAQGLDYPGFFSYVCNPALIKTKRLSSSAMFTKGF